ncbi:DUF3034 family protein [Sphingomonas ginkgonis]|uniref:DUF3034 family protein n=1 Tax=Sphingomonas ginkgonis TaxID=2315330 RepID=A0A3R9Z5F3_9SPHN|nr:DUF3034 family protein [Sphingomonas ginkgonis]RST30198.1 DUF3034 family protein [Sphingomonas ginkgonis]
MFSRLTLCAAAAAVCCSSPVLARSEWRAGGKLLLTNGVSTVDGPAGGGLATWAVIAGEETSDGIGGSVHATYVPLRDFALTGVGAAIGYRDRIEISVAHNSFDTRAAGAALGLGRGFRFNQDDIGVKVRLFGHAVYDQDRLLPQVAVGLEYKRADKDAIIHAVGGRHASGVDVYVAATKLLLRHSLLLNGTVRLTRANQFGLLGFGGDRDHGYRPQAEGSAALLLSRNLAVGAEARTKPDNLGFAREQDSYDLFLAWAPAHHLTVTTAYVDLGDIATFRRQTGAFLSLQASF